MKALEYQFLSGSNILGFYLDRAKALYASRVMGDRKSALAALRRMDAAVTREEELTRKILPIAEDDSRIGFHSEAEAHQYHPAKLKWRLGELAKTHKRILEIAAAVSNGGKYPESAFERAAPSCEIGDFVRYPGGRFRVRIEENGDYTFDVEMEKKDNVTVCTLDAAGVSWYRQLIVCANGKVIPTGGWNCALRWSEEPRCPRALSLPGLVCNTQTICVLVFVESAISSATRASLSARSLVLF